MRAAGEGEDDSTVGVRGFGFRMSMGVKLTGKVL